MRFITSVAFSAALVFPIAVGPAAAAPSAIAESVFGPTDIAAIAGNGGLTIAVNQSGRLTNCRWPGPGDSEQITYTTKSRSEPLLGVEPWHGAGWALQVDGQLIWLHDDRWSHQRLLHTGPERIEIESTMIGRDLRVHQQWTVSGDGNGYTTRITVNGDLDGAPGVYWYANYSPSTLLIPHFPFALTSRNDFASFVDDDLSAICHFRPEDPSSHLWRIARGLADDDEHSEEWTTFPKGVYVLYGTAGTVNNMTVGPEEGPASVASQVSAGSLSEHHSITGQTASAISLKLASKNEGYTATIFTAFGTHYDEAAQRYRAIRDDQQNTMPTATERTETENERIMRLAMSTIHACTDGTTGSVVRAPTNTPPLAIDWPRFGIWVAIAHDAADDRERARRILEFYAAHARKQVRVDVPIGSMPAAVYTNGVEATPEAIVDAAAAGRVLWAIEHHGSLLNQEQMQGFYRSVWDGVNAIADFLVQWREPGGTAPLYTFDYEQMRDRRTTELYVASHLGLQAANRIADKLYEQRLDWRQAANELRDALRLHAIEGDGTITVANPGMLYDTGIIRASEQYNWPEAITEFIRNSGDRLDTIALEHLCKLVLSAHDLPEALRSDITARLKRHLDRESPDAADAAFVYLVAHRLQLIEDTPPAPIQELSPDTP